MVADMKSDNGAGLSLTRSGLNNPNPIQHGRMGQAERAFSVASTFLSGMMAISASQFIGAPLKLVDPKFYKEYMAWTKESFAVLVTTITQFWAPTVIRVSGDESMKGQLYQMDDGTLKCNFPHRLVLMANHQLYTDWLYLWWVAYTNKMHGHIYIIMKESLKQLPIIGWSAQFYNFIFLSRHWETDRLQFKQALNHLKNPKDAMWLLIFPEGTNLSAFTRDKSAAWAKKTGQTDMKNQLLPRSTGLQFSLKELRSTTNWLYDCTIAYEGVPRGMYGQDIFTLRSSFLEGRPPKSVNMFWRRFRISDIPIDNDEAFGRWLNNRWREKDYMLEYFNKFNHFPADDPVKALQRLDGKSPPHHAKHIATEVKAGGWDEFLSIFGPITSAAGALSAVDMTEPLNIEALLGQVTQSQQLSLMSLGKNALPATSQEAIRRALRAANKQVALPEALMSALLTDTPSTQQAMQQMLQRSGIADIAKRATQAPAQHYALPPKMPQNIDRSTLTAQDAIDQVRRTAQAKKAASPAAMAKQAMPMANTNAMITRPFSTYAVHTAASSLRNVSAPQTKQNSASLPGQTKPASSANAPESLSRAVKQPSKPANALPKLDPKTAASVAQSAPLKAGLANGVAQPGGRKVSFAPPAQQKKAPGSASVGTPKIVNGVRGTKS